MVSVLHASVSLETYMLVDRHTFSDKHISFYVLCFQRLRFKKCSCIPSSFVFLQVLMKKAGLLQYHMQDKNNKTLTWDVPHQLLCLNKFVSYDYNRSKQWYWETDCPLNRYQILVLSHVLLHHALFLNFCICGNNYTTSIAKETWYL